MVPIHGVNSHGVLVHCEAFHGILIKHFTIELTWMGYTRVLRDPGSSLASELALCHILDITGAIFRYTYYSIITTFHDQKGTTLQRR